MSAGVVYTHWGGWIESLQPAVNQYGERTVEITAAGVMQFYKAAETEIALQENQRTDQIIAELIKEVVVPSPLGGVWLLGIPGSMELGISTILGGPNAYSELEEGRVTLAIAADNWVRRGGDTNEAHDTFNIYRAIQDVVAAERGRFFFDRAGKAIFWNRQHLTMYPAVAATFDNTMTDLSYTYAGLDHFKNDIVVTCHPREIGDSDQEVLWELSDEIKVSIGAERTVTAKYSDGSGTVTLDARANSARLTIENTGSVPAVLSGCVVRGKKITDYGRMEAAAEDPISMAKYGRRTLNMNLPSVDNFADAERIAERELARRKDPQGAVGTFGHAGKPRRGGRHAACAAACALHRRQDHGQGGADRPR